MKIQMCFFRRVAVATAAVLLLGVRAVFAQQSAQETPPPVPSEELPAGSLIMASGPVHEAFAKPVSLDPQAPIVVPNQPPANLQEVPPSEKPLGAGVVWVSGYWAWDADRNDFIWVSGCWRNAPPDTYWVPGYWLQADNGWQWIGGFWAPIAAQAQQTIEYLPVPPAMAGVESVGTPPQPDQTWVPGCWYWVQDRYVWRPGYWMVQQVGWVWLPSHYVWTPRGYIFCQGHWDYDLDNRGVLFTPTYFPPAVRVLPGFVFCPSVCVDLGVLRLNLFAYPRYRHYYFGDYYDDSYRGVGIYPWFQCQTVHTWYDPLFVYDRWHYRQTDPHWADNRAHDFEQRRTNRDLRPPRTFAEERDHAVRQPLSNRRSERPLVQPLKTYVASPTTPIKFERVNAADRQQLSTRATEDRKLRDQRNRWESPAVQPATGVHGATRRQTTTETRAASEAAVNPPVTRSTARPVKETKPSEVSQPQADRVTRPTNREVAPATARPVKETKPAEVSQPQADRVTRPNREVAPAAARPVKETRPAEVSQPQAVRGTRPNREVVPNLPKVQNLSDSRSAAKEPPSRPSEERSRMDPAAGRGTSDRDRDALSNRGR